MKNIILCDIDGTVANNDHRQNLLKEYQDWDIFFSELVNDEPIFKVIDLIKLNYKNGFKVVFVTGRPERYRKMTSDWLNNYFDFKIEILMRPDADKRNKLIIKKDMLENFNYSQQIKKIYENDIDLIKLWEELGYEVVNVGSI